MSTDSDALPVYKAREVPAHLRTTTQLKAQRLKPTEGQQPLGYVRVYRRGHGWGEFYLYDPGQAAPMRPLSAKQQATMQARRTCPQCGCVRDYVVVRVCQECAVKEHQERMDLQSRTCFRCRRVSVVPRPYGRDGRCEPCWLHWVIQRQFEAERHAVWSRTCPGRDCQKVTATDEEIAAARADRYRPGGWVPRWCPPCQEQDEQERAERAREAREAEERAIAERRRRVAALVDWARALLAAPDTVVLDTETTGLEHDSRIVEVAVYSTGGEVLLNTLVNPGEPIPPDVSELHGITDDRVTDAPSFTEILPQLTKALDGRNCLIYNAPYDVGRLRHELTLHYRQAGHEDPAASAAAWLEEVRREDVMLPYSEWVGDWSDYHGDYAWQPLIGGDHRALSDCRAVVETLRGMAGSDENVA